MGNYKDRIRNFRLEHIYVIEQYLSKHPELEISKKFLIDGKYLKIGCEIHHINQNPQDNKIENLWVYKTKNDHAEGELSLRDSLQFLIKTNRIRFKDGRYYINQDNNSTLNHSTEVSINQDIKEPINYKDINLVKDEIKKISWEKISNNWTVKNRINQFVEKKIQVDPTRECSVENPLYKHKEWVERIIKDKRYNLTDSRFGKLCGISRDKARYWRDKVHNIKGKTDWGYDRIVDPSDGRIWIKVPDDYENPIVKKEDHQRRNMLEHRYNMERYLSEHPELRITQEALIDGKYLKTEYQVHHINLDFQDNRIENLWVFKNNKLHLKARESLYALVEDLLKQTQIIFKDGKYEINKEKN